MTTTKKRNILFISSLVLSGVYFLPPSSQVHAVEKQTEPVIQYQTHVQNKDWQKVVSNGKLAGTTGENLRVEALSISPQKFDGNIEYQTHVQNIGWQKVATKGQVSGTTGKALQVEAIKMRLTGKDSKKWTIQYRTHVKNIGWQDWRNEGEISGTTGQNLQVEGIQIRLVEKEVTPPVEQKPIIQLKDVTINQGETFDYASPIVKAVDEKGNPLTLDQLTVTGQVDTSKVGQVVLYYTYKDVTEQTIVTVKGQENTLDENIIRQEMVRLVNEYRQENGKQSVKSNDLFHQCTDVRAKELEQLYSHTRPNGKGFSTVCTEDFNHPLVGRIGENIGEFMYDKNLTNKQVAQNMIDGWKSSNPHNMNMLNDYHTDFGFGIHRGINEYHTEVIFGVQWFYHEKTDGGEWERP